MFSPVCENIEGKRKKKTQNKRGAARGGKGWGREPRGESESWLWSMRDTRMCGKATVSTTKLIQRS